MTDESYLRDLEQAATAVGDMPNSYQQLRSLLAALPDPTNPDLRPGRVAPQKDGSLQSGLTTMGLTLQSPVQVGASAGIDLGVATSGFIGGSSFPADKKVGDAYFRQDLGMFFFWDGTRWLSVQLFTTQLTEANQPYTITSGNAQQSGVPSLQGGTDLFLVRLRNVVAIAAGGTALGASHKWVGTFRSGNAAFGVGGETLLATTSFDSGPDLTWKAYETAIGVINSGTAKFVFLQTWTKTGTPGSLVVHTELTYRVVTT